MVVVRVWVSFTTCWCSVSVGNGGVGVVVKCLRRDWVSVVVRSGVIEVACASLSLHEAEKTIDISKPNRTCSLGITKQDVNVT